MTNAERLSFLASEIDKLLSVKKQSRILLKRNDYEFLEKRAVVWLNKNPNHLDVPDMEGFTFTTGLVKDKPKVTGVKFKGTNVIDIESVKMVAA